MYIRYKHMSVCGAAIGILLSVYIVPAFTMDMKDSYNGYYAYVSGANY